MGRRISDLLEVYMNPDRKGLLPGVLFGASQEDKAMSVIEYVLLATVLVPSLVIHEFMHALTATRLGDPTPGYEGRLTLSPFAHFDPIGAVMLILMMVTGVGIGWARPVGVNPRYLKNPTRDMMLIALAGPASNLALALSFGLALRFLAFVDISWGLQLFLQMGTIVNLGLLVFNLIPVPPLDGSRILLHFLRGRAWNLYRSFEGFGMYIVLLLVYLPITRYFLIVLPRSVMFSLITGM